MTESRNYIVHPYKFNLWLFLLTLIMVFGGLTSAYIVSKSFTPIGKIVHFALPSVLQFNTFIIIFSSITLQLGVMWAKRNDNRKSIYALIFTFLLGLLFLVGQYSAFNQLTAGGFPFVDNTRSDNSVAFFYMFTGLHGIHIVAALIVVGVGIYRTANHSFKEKIVSYEVIATFWHFLGLLWLYLYLFLIYNQN